jgi:hypothetical protein
MKTTREATPEHGDYTMTAYNRISPLLLLGCVALLGAAGTAMPAAAQGAGTRPIFLALPERFPDLGARVVLMREPGRDILVLKDADATPEALKVALLLLQRMEREHPPLADRGQLIPVTGFVSRREMPPAERQRLEGLLAELRERPLANVGNLGRGRWMPYRNP